MSLSAASIEQLLQWQNDIVSELARRAAAAEEPIEAQPPWATGRPLTAREQAAKASQADLARKLNDEHWRQEQKMRAMMAAYEAQLDAETDAAPALTPTIPLAAPALPPPELRPQAPALLGGVRMTARSDPTLAQAFASVPTRQEGTPPINGTGPKPQFMVNLGPSSS